MLIQGCVLALAISHIFASDQLFDSCPTSTCSCVASSLRNDVLATCSEQALSQVPVIASTRPVTNLMLSHNSLMRMRNASFSHFPVLTSLDVSDNKIQAVDEGAFEGLQLLRDLDLSFNDVLTLHPLTFSRTPLLEKINLKGNQRLLLPVSSPFIVSDSILTLDLSACRLSSLYPQTLSQLPELHSLDLSDNSLRSVPLKSLENSKKLRIVNVAGNLWSCNCELASLLSWLEDRGNAVYGTVQCVKEGLLSAFDRDVICQPGEIEDMALAPVTPEENVMGGNSADEDALDNVPPEIDFLGVELEEEQDVLGYVPPKDGALGAEPPDDDGLGAVPMEYDLDAEAPEYDVQGAVTPNVLGAEFPEDDFLGAAPMGNYVVDAFPLRDDVVGTVPPEEVLDSFLPHRLVLEEGLARDFEFDVVEDFENDGDYANPKDLEVTEEVHFKRETLSMREEVFYLVVFAGMLAVVIILSLLAVNFVVNKWARSPGSSYSNLSATRV